MVSNLASIKLNEPNCPGGELKHRIPTVTNFGGQSKRYLTGVNYSPNRVFLMASGCQKDGLAAAIAKNIFKISSF